MFTYLCFFLLIFFLIDCIHLWSISVMYHQIVISVIRELLVSVMCLELKSDIKIKFFIKLFRFIYAAILFISNQKLSRKLEQNCTSSFFFHNSSYIIKYFNLFYYYYNHVFQCIELSSKYKLNVVVFFDKKIWWLLLLWRLPGNHLFGFLFLK